MFPLPPRPSILFEINQQTNSASFFLERIRKGSMLFLRPVALISKRKVIIDILSLLKKMQLRRLPKLLPCVTLNRQPPPNPHPQKKKKSIWRLMLNVRNTLFPSCHGMETLFFSAPEGGAATRAKAGSGRDNCRTSVCARRGCARL